VNRVKLRYRSAPLPASVLAECEVGAGRHRTLELTLAEPADGVAPGQMACLMDGELVVGCATIAR
jgi:tRNA-specific 2-thiouridylase